MYFFVRLEKVINKCWLEKSSILIQRGKIVSSSFCHGTTAAHYQTHHLTTVIAEITVCHHTPGPLADDFSIVVREAVIRAQCHLPSTTKQQQRWEGSFIQMWNSEIFTCVRHDDKSPNSPACFEWVRAGALPCEVAMTSRSEAVFGCSSETCVVQLTYTLPREIMLIVIVGQVVGFLVESVIMFRLVWLTGCSMLCGDLCFS